MMPARPRAPGTSFEAWNVIEHDVTLRHSRMVRGFNEQRQKDLLGLGYEERQKGNAGYYLHGRVELEIRDTNNRAQALYDACCEVRDIHGLKKDRAFYRAVFEYCLEPLFGTRRATITAELQLRYVRMRTAGNSSAAIGSLSRRMDQLRSDWNIKLEIETRDNEARERSARERNIDAPASVARGPQESDQLSSGQPKSRLGRKPRLPHEFTVFAADLWKQRQGPTKHVIESDLKWMAAQLDAKAYTPPSDYLERKAAGELKQRNSRTANSKAGPILNWGDLVARGDKHTLRAMRKLMSRCARKHP